MTQPDELPKITREEYDALLWNLDTDESTLLGYSRVVRGDRGFEITLLPNPDLVEVTEQELAEESALQIGNSWCRWRRARRFQRRRRRGDRRPVLVSEGDSWFQFPLLIDEVVDHLGKDYSIWSVGAGGDTAQNMVFGPLRKKKTEYMRALNAQRGSVRAFLFSAAGNDIIGEDDSGNAALFDILRPFNGNESDVFGHINFRVLGERLSELRRAYAEVVRTIRRDPDFAKLPILIHGYDYVFPYPFGADDPRDPSYAKKDEWLGEPFQKRKISSPALRRAIVTVLIDALYDMLDEVAGEGASSQVWVVDCRGAMPDLSDWNDEIHGTSEGFAKVAERFREVLADALGPTG